MVYLFAASITSSGKNICTKSEPQRPTAIGVLQKIVAKYIVVVGSVANHAWTIKKAEGMR